jgi:hypothetical protein
MVRLDPLERLRRVLEDTHTATTDVLGDEEVPLNDRFAVIESCMVAIESIKKVVAVIEPYYPEEVPE